MFLPTTCRVVKTSIPPNILRFVIYTEHQFGFICNLRFIIHDECSTINLLKLIDLLQPITEIGLVTYQHDKIEYQKRKKKRKTNKQTILIDLKFTLVSFRT